MTTVKSAAQLHKCKTEECPSDPFRLGYGAGRDKNGYPRCGSCYRWFLRNPDAVERPPRNESERPVAAGEEKRKCITAYVLPELNAHLEKDKKRKGFATMGHYIVHMLANGVGLPALGPRVRRKRVASSPRGKRVGAADQQPKPA